MLCSQGVINTFLNLRLNMLKSLLNDISLKSHNNNFDQKCVAKHMQRIATAVVKFF